MFDKYTHPLHCHQCGKWHYGKSIIGKAEAQRDAERQQMVCRKQRDVLRLKDEMDVSEVQR